MRMNNTEKRTPSNNSHKKTLDLQLFMENVQLASHRYKPDCFGLDHGAVAIKNLVS